MSRWLILAALLASPAAAETIFVSDEASDCVTAIDGATLKPIECIHVGKRPRGLVASSDGRRLYVAVGDDNRIAIVDTATRKLLRSFPTPDPETFALSPDERDMFIANENDSLMSQIRIADGKVLRQVQVGGEPEGTAVSPDGKLVVQASETGSMAHVIDAATGAVKSNLIVDTRPRYIAFTPDGSRFWVSSEVRGTVTVFDAASLKPAGKIDFDSARLTNNIIQAVGTRFTRDGRRAFVALGRGKLVAEVDPASLKIVRTWPVGLRAWNLALSPDESRLYTADGLDGTMSVIDLKTNSARAPVKLGGKPWGIVAVP
ncbi:MAG TPA: PQQ-dependent catabolism-associated beta-propeller protein [Sphingomicrobium sp.]